jgi:chaperonin GroES
MKLAPLNDRLVVKAIEPEEKTASGIYLPDQAKERPQRGSVIAVGPGRYEDGKRVPMQVAAGDEVVYARYGGTEIRLDGEDYIILRESDVLAKAE